MFTLFFFTLFALLRFESICCYTNSKKASIIRIDCRTFGSVGLDDLNSLSEQLFRCETSLNPFDRLRSAGLRERIQFIRQQELQKKLEEVLQREREERQKEREDRQKDREEQQKNLEEKLQREREEREKEREEQNESKIIKCVSSQGFLDDYKITRKTIDAWQERGLSLRELTALEDGTSISKRVETFEHVNVDKTFELTHNDGNFNGYASIEGIVQTRNCAESIISGKALIPPFNEQGTEVIYEPKFAAPKGFVIPPNLGFQLPINPDAMLIHGTSWLLIESKHSCSRSEIDLFRKKVNFIRANADQPWVYKNHQIPTLIIGAINSIGPFREGNVRAQGDDLIKLLRSGLPFEIQS